MRTEEKVDFTRTKAAIEKLYDANDRLVALRPDQTSAEWSFTYDALKKAENDVRYAFWQDTADRNSLNNCMRAGIKWIRKAVGKATGSDLI